VRFLKQSTSVDLVIGPFLDDVDGKTAETALTITQPDIRLKKGSAAWAQKAAAQTLTHEENGNYEVTLDATDTNTLGYLRVHVHEAGALPVWEDFMVMPANVWDSLFGADALQVHAVEISNGLITAAAIAADAITDAKVASDVTIASVTGAVGSVTGNVGGNVAGTIGGLTAAALKDFFDTDSTTTFGSAVAGSVVKEIADNAGGGGLSAGDIADAVWDETRAGHATPGTFGEGLALADGGITRATFAPDTGLQTIRSGTVQAGSEIEVMLDSFASGDDDFYKDTYIYITGGNGAGNVRKIIDYVGSTKIATIDRAWTGTNAGTGSTYAILPNPPEQEPLAPLSAPEIADAVWAEVLEPHVEIIGSAAEALETARENVDPWITPLPGAYGAGTAGKLVGDNIDAAISSRLATAGYTAPPTVGDIAEQVWEEPIDDHSGVAGSAAEALANAESEGDPWGTPLPGAYGAGTAGQLVGDRLDAAVSTRATPAQARTEADAALAAVGVTSTVTGRVDAAITTRASQASLDTIDGIVDALTVAVAALNDISTSEVLAQVNAALETAVPDSVPAVGNRPSVKQAAYMSTQFLVERTLSGTTLTVKKPSGAALFTITLNDASVPTATTRAT
jgi:hypothetical protein